MGQTSFPVNAILVTSAGLVGSSTGTGSATMLSAADARTLLSVSTTAAIAAAYQPLDATLTALAGVTTAADTVIYATGADTFSTTSLTTFGRSLIDDADASTARTTLGLGTMALEASASYLALAGGTLTGNLGIGSSPTHPLTVSSANMVTSGGVAFYSTTDQTTNYQRLRVHGAASNIWTYVVESAGTGTAGFHRWMVNATTVMEIDSQSAYFYGRMMAGTDNTSDIGRLSTAPFRFRSMYLGTSIQVGAPANTAIAATGDFYCKTSSTVGAMITGAASQSADYLKCRTSGSVAEFSVAPGGHLTLAGLTSLGPYTFATLPSASANSGKLLRITDRGQKQAYSDGTNWLFVHDNSVVI